MEELLSTTASSETPVSIEGLLLCILVALALGLVLSAVYGVRNRHSKSFATTLVLLPAIVCVVIAAVNGNLGVGIAVLGAFSLVRFRSVPGSGRDIAFIFLAMAVGLVCGMGHLAVAAMVTAVISAAYLALQLTGFNGFSKGTDRTLRVTVPEDLDYAGAFDDLFAQYTAYHELVTVRTSEMGSLYKLVYNVGMKDAAQEKAFIDAIRCRNGNLEVSLSHQDASSEAL